MRSPARPQMLPKLDLLAVFELAFLATEFVEDLDIVVINASSRSAPVRCP